MASASVPRKPPPLMRVDRHEVWSAGWGLYRVVKVYVGGLGGSYEVATVWGRDRAIRRARQLQGLADDPPAPPRPVFSTRRNEVPRADQAGGS